MMKFDIRRYERRRFHKDEEVDKKIKALFLLFDYEVTRNKLSFVQQLTLIDDWIIKFERFELYEVIPMFKLRRGVILRQIIRREQEKMSFSDYLAPSLKKIFYRIKNFFKSLFKKK